MKKLSPFSDLGQQRVSTPWRKESHESLFRRNKEGRISIGLDDTPETDEPDTAIHVDDRDPLGLDLEKGSVNLLSLLHSVLIPSDILCDLNCTF